MRFAYSRHPSTRLVYPLGGYWRDYPTCDLGIGSGGHFQAHRALFDIGSDGTIFPLSLAVQLGIDLSASPPGQAQVVGGTAITFHYAHVMLRLSDGVEHAEWPAIVGFAPVPMRRALLGRTGFHQFFDVTYRGAAGETVLLPNGTFPGVYGRH